MSHNTELSDVELESVVGGNNQTINGDFVDVAQDNLQMNVSVSKD